MKDFARRSEIISRKNIKRCYRDIDMLYYELYFLNNLLSKYSNKKAGTSFSVYERQNEMASIREQIPRVYKDINFYKECINVEKREMKRIRETYGYNSEYEDRPNQSYNDNYDNNYNDIYEDKPNQYYNDDYDDYDDNESEISDYEEVNTSDRIQEDDDLEEIKDYKYNPVTDTFE